MSLPECLSSACARSQSKASPRAGDDVVPIPRAEVGGAAVPSSPRVGAKTEPSRGRWLSLARGASLISAGWALFYDAS